MKYYSPTTLKMNTESELVNYLEAIGGLKGRKE